MAPIQSGRTDKENRVRQILCKSPFLSKGGEVASRSPGSLVHEIEKAIATFPSNLGTAAASKCEEIDSTATVLWNLCTRLRRDNESETPQDPPAVLDTARVYAFLFLCCAHGHGKPTTSNIFRLMKIGFKAAKCSIGRKEYDMASKVLERLGKFETMLKDAQRDMSVEDGEACQHLASEYFVLRTLLAWHQKQTDIVEHMYKNACSEQRKFDPDTAESLADVLYEMGKSLLGTAEYPLAIKWLDRALEILAGQELEKLSMDASELRISIIQSTVKARIHLKDEKSLEEARDHINVLQSELGDRLIVLVLRLEILEATPEENFDSAAYSDVLGRITRSAILNDDNFRLVMFHIRKLNAKNPASACKSLSDLLKLRITRDSADERRNWMIEKALITRVWMAVGQRDSLDTLSTLEDFLNVIVTDTEGVVSQTASLAAHTLLWKRIEANYAQRQYDLAEKWCRLAMHNVFQSSGDLNMARMSRKLLLCAIEQQDDHTAVEILNSMSPAAKKEPMTRFLMYKLAIRMNQIETASQSLEAICLSESSDPALLYACCLHSIEGGNKKMTLAALQLVLEKFNYGPPTPVHLPSLLRITVGLTSSLLQQSPGGTEPTEAENLVDKLCKLFEGAVTAIRKSRKTSSTEIVWTVAELDWFSKNSYNTSIKHISTWPPVYVLRMLECCIAFINQYPQGIPEQVSQDLSLRKMFCQFSAATAITTLARGEDNIPQQLQYYTDLRKHVASFDNLLQDKLDHMEEFQSQDLLQKLSILLTFDFEAACHLKNWDALGPIILNANICKSMRAYELMADCVLSIQPPAQVLVATLKKIINEAWALDCINSMNLARYMRCLFQIALPSSEATAEQLLEQVAAHAKEARETEQPYPSEELDWIATKAFNHAVDLYLGQQEDACKVWASKAINVAHYVDDGRNLERLLQEKLAGLLLES